MNHMKMVALAIENMRQNQNTQRTIHIATPPKPDNDMTSEDIDMRGNSYYKVQKEKQRRGSIMVQVEQAPTTATSLP